MGGDRKPVPAKGREDFPYEGSDKTWVDTERMMENMKDQGMPMVMQSREDMMEELYEQMEAEGLSREEADASWSRSRVVHQLKKSPSTRRSRRGRRSRTTTKTR